MDMSEKKIEKRILQQRNKRVFTTKECDREKKTHARLKDYDKKELQQEYHMAKKKSGGNMALEDYDEYD